MKFKLSKKSRVLLGAGIFIIALLSLWLAQLQQTQMGARAQQELAQAELLIKKLTTSDDLVSQKEELEDSLNEAESDLVAAKNHLEQSLETIESSDDIFGIAGQSGVTITRINSSAPTDEEVGGVPCSAITVTVQVDGTMINLIYFVSGLTEKYGAAMVRSVLIDLPSELDIVEGEGDSGGSDGDDGSGEDGSVEEETKDPHLVVTLLIYDYRSD